MTLRRRGSPRARWPRSTRRMRRSRVAAPPGRARAATQAGRHSSKTRRRRDGAGRPDRSPRGRSPDASTHRERSGLGMHRFAPTARTGGRAPRRRSVARLRSDSLLSIASRRVPATRPARWSGRGSETSVGRPRRRSRTPSSASWSLVGSAATPSVRSRRSSRPTSTGSPGRSPGIPSSWPPRGSSRRISTGGGLPGGIASWSGTTQAHRRAAPPERPPERPRAPDRPISNAARTHFRRDQSSGFGVRFRSIEKEESDFARRAISEESPFEVGPKPSGRGDRPPITGRRPIEREMIRAISPTVTRTGPAGRMIRSYSARDLGRDPRHLNRHQVNRRPTVDP